MYRLGGLKGNFLISGDKPLNNFYLKNKINIISPRCLVLQKKSLFHDSHCSFVNTFAR